MGALNGPYSPCPRRPRQPLPPRSRGRWQASARPQPRGGGGGAGQGGLAEKGSPRVPPTLGRATGRAPAGPEGRRERRRTPHPGGWRRGGAAARRGVGGGRFGESIFSPAAHRDEVEGLVEVELGLDPHRLLLRAELHLLVRRRARPGLLLHGAPPRPAPLVPPSRPPAPSGPPPGPPGGPAPGGPSAARCGGPGRLLKFWRAGTACRELHGVRAAAVARPNPRHTVVPLLLPKERKQAKEAVEECQEDCLQPAPRPSPTSFPPPERCAPDQDRSRAEPGVRRG